ncbi:hypothetical protein [Ancylobacter mangrovi]|uniref:hypothetical protein n=1 Tax=Ancylobacter mangrovi TaxID=2972472 RepID=UPI002161A2F8|nr:hypothetical protein [Ancylobacter mangrovi]MCS0502569.1 hypothetical protein [Ancylobacter mangrovi]
MKPIKKPSRSLSFEDAITVWNMRLDGEIQSRIAARFDVNQGRICEVLAGQKHPGAEAAARSSRN